MKAVSPIILIPLCIIFLECSQKKSTEQLKAELSEKERRNPLYYLALDSLTDTKNMVLVRKAGLFRSAEYKHDGNHLEGTISNTATLSTFKDVVVTVSYFSHTETLIGKEDHTIYEFYRPNSVSRFKIHVYPPNEVEKITMKISSASSITDL